MMSFAFVGWALLFGAGLLLTKSSIAMMIYARSFTGKLLGNQRSDTTIILVTFLVGITLLIITLRDVPFTVSMK
jgi:hypothetical protein